MLSIFSSLGSMNKSASAKTTHATTLLQPIIPFFLNPSSYQLQSPNNETTIALSSFQYPAKSTNDLIASSSSISTRDTINTTNWNSVNTTLGIQFKIPPFWIAKQFESTNSEGRTETETKGVSFTSPDSDVSFFMVNVTDSNSTQTRGLSEIANSLTQSIQNITKQDTTIFSGLPAYEIVSLREVQASSPDEEDTAILLNITDLIVTNNNKLYHIKYGAEADDIASSSGFKDVLDTFTIDNAESLSLNRARANEAQIQNVSSSDEEEGQQEEQEEVEDRTPPTPLQRQEQSQPQFGSLPMQQQSPYIQSQPTLSLAPQYPYNQPMISQPYSPYNPQQPQYVIPQNPIIPPPAPQPPQPIPPIALPPRILSHSNYTDAIGDFHIVGEVINEFSQPIRLVKITATLDDATSRVIGTAFAYSSPLDLQPGQIAHFHIIVLQGSVPIHLMTSYALTASSG